MTRPWYAFNFGISMSNIVVIFYKNWFETILSFFLLIQMTSGRSLLQKIGKIYVWSMYVFKEIERYCMHKTILMICCMYTNVQNWVYVDCKGRCAERCKLSGRPNLCHRACGTCCARCNCVPPGTYGNHDVCPCYANMTTHGGRKKCPWSLSHLLPRIFFFFSE